MPINIDFSDLEKLQKNLEKVEGDKQVELPDLMPDHFIREHANFQSLQAQLRRHKFVSYSKFFLTLIRESIYFIQTHFEGLKTLVAIPRSTRFSKRMKASNGPGYDAFIFMGHASSFA